MEPESKKRLEDFIERADYIESLSYLDGGEEIVGFKGKKVDGKLEVEFFQPGDEVRDALLFNIRLFIQDKDVISLRRLQDLYTDEGISNEWKEYVQEFRNELNARLNRIAAEGPKGKLTHRDVLDMFLYGSLGHKIPNDKARKLYEKWITDDIQYELLHNTFHTVCIIRSMSSTKSGACRPLNPEHVVHFLSSTGMGGRHQTESSTKGGQ